MSPTVEASSPFSRTSQAALAQLEEEKREAERLARMRAPQPLAEEPLHSEPAMADAPGERTVMATHGSTHMQSLDMRLEAPMASSPQQAVSFAVRAALELMWDDISEMEERTDRIPRQAHLAMLMARVKSR